MQNTCANCNAYQAHDDRQGLCLANPPVPLVVGMTMNKITGEQLPLIRAFWPSVAAGNGCRSHQPAVELSKIDLSRLGNLQVEGSA